MKLLLAGGSGLVGGVLQRWWAQAGYDVRCLVRRPPRTEREIEWQPGRDAGPAAVAGEFDAIVNLAGENIAAGRWTAARKERIRSSRLLTTAALANAIAAGRLGARTWINASAVGFYGDTGEVAVDEDCPRGPGFLAEVCGEWEAQAMRVGASLRVVCLRLGVVLDGRGGALGRLLPVFRAGLGGPIGDGTAWLSWIGSDELCRVVDHVLADERLAGPVNAVELRSVRSRDFAGALGRCLGRPAVVPTPAWALRAVFGAMARETVLASQRVVPKRLLETGHLFAARDVGGALAAVLAAGGRAYGAKART